MESFCTFCKFSKSRPKETSKCLIGAYLKHFKKDPTQPFPTSNHEAPFVKESLKANSLISY